MPLLLAILVAILSVTLVSILVERVIIARVKNMTVLVSLIVTLGVSILLEAGMLILWGPEAKGLPALPGEDLLIGGVSIRSQELWMLGALVVVGGGIVFFYERTKWGKALRACAEQPTAARIVGISPVMASVVAFGSRDSSAPSPGSCTRPIYLTIWSGGLLLGLKGFVAAVLGGLTSFRAAIVGALLLGMLESYVSAYIASGLRDAVAFFILIAVLIFRTQGLVLKPREGRA